MAARSLIWNLSLDAFNSKSDMFLLRKNVISAARVKYLHSQMLYIAHARNVSENAMRFDNNKKQRRSALFFLSVDRFNRFNRIFHTTT